MATGDCALAWRVLRQVDDYVDAWDRHAAAVGEPALEPVQNPKAFDQTRTRVLDGMLRTRFQSWYPGLFNAANTDQEIELAA